MKLLTKAIENKFAKTGDLSQTPIDDITVICKWFNPCGGHTWYVYERLDDDIFMAFVTDGNPMFAECGTVSLAELQSITLPFGMSIERDINFEPRPLKEIIDTIKAGGHV